MLKFRTTLQVDGCVRKVKRHLDEIPQIGWWNVDLQSSAKVMKAFVPADAKDEVAQEVILAIAKEGYAAEKLN